MQHKGHFSWVLKDGWDFKRPRKYKGEKSMSKVIVMTLGGKLEKL